jgi:uncharacterized delta-60 repeat protein
MIFNSKYKIVQFLSAVSLLFICGLTSCKKNESIGKDPYGDAKPPLDLKVNALASNPAQGDIASTVTLTGSGFLKYKTTLNVLFNGQKGEILSLSDTEAKVKVPEWASSGVITFMVGAQILPGPKFQVNGNIKIDKAFNSYVGANEDINNITALPDGRMLILGNFTDYNNSGIRSGYSKLAIISAEGILDKSFKPGKGIPSGNLNKAALLLDGKILIGGQFNTYNNKKGRIGNIGKISLNGAMDSTIYSFIDRSGEPKKDTVPSFAAFFSGPVTEMMVQPDGNIIVGGAFKYYIKKCYYPNQKDTIITDSVVVNNMARIKPDGSLDKTYNFNLPANPANDSFNGYIYDAHMQADGKIIVTGAFSSYNGESVNRIARINTDGTLDKSFSIGSGPNDLITSIQPYVNGQVLISGSFSTFNGKAVSKVAILNQNGGVEESFNTGVGADGAVTKASRLGNGKILLTGSFQKFNGINRYGFAVVEPTGQLSPNNNTIGGFIFTDNRFRNPVFDVINVDNGKAAILVGGFSSLDLQQNNRLVKITY